MVVRGGGRSAVGNSGCCGHRLLAELPAELTDQRSGEVGLLLHVDV